ncbi:MAG: YkgJ family cysteine cluster protein, partial [Candidatus Micrarchaeota archaeon]|nr:YkgJ family cysteine cluster protein [Candidatus Micrarchaeota archaeon]
MNCTRCGACCTNFGVCITPYDIRRISAAISKQHPASKPSEFVDTVQDYPGRERTEPALLIDGEMQILIL